MFILYKCVIPLILCGMFDFDFLFPAPPPPACLYLQLSYMQ